jgi:4'-phosphopantetheinyl transferase
MTEPEATLGGLRETRQVQLWTVALGGQDAWQGEYWKTLSSDERERAGRFRFVRDRERFVAARGKLRWLLAEYLALSPAEVVFEYGAHGKPSVAGEKELRFNLAHSGEYALYAFCAGRRVGVDIEQIRSIDDQEALARRFFSRKECDDLMSVATNERNAAFFAGWTRKEAFVKATGAGLTMGLQSFRVALLPGLPAALLASEWDGKWTMFDVHPADGYRAAVVVEGDGYELHSMKSDFAMSKER